MLGVTMRVGSDRPKEAKFSTSLFFAVATILAMRVEALAQRIHALI
jgi:hypothetical protein